MAFRNRDQQLRRYFQSFLLLLSFILLEGFINDKYAGGQEKDTSKHNFGKYIQISKYTPNRSFGEAYLFNRLFWLASKKNSYVPKINQDIFRNYKDQQDDGEEVKINYEKSNSEDSHTHNKILPLKKEAKGKYMLVNDHAFLMQNIHTYEEGGTWNIGKASMEVGKEEGADDNPQVSEWDFISEGEHHPYPYFGVFLSMTLLTSIVVIIVKCSG